MPSLKKSKSISKIRVVAADDDPIIRQLMESKLVAMGCEAIIAEDGADAWRLIRDKKPDLALVDLEMPNIDGIGLIQCIRGHPRTKHLPIVVITTRSDADAIQNAFSAGATSFLTKPVHWSTFESHVTYLMRLTETAVQASARVQTAEAAMRVKDTVLRRALTTCSDGMGEAKEVLERVIAQINAVAKSGDVGAITGVISYIDEVSDICGQVEAAMQQTEALSRDLCAKVSADVSYVPLINLLANAQTHVSDLANRRNVPISIVRQPEGVYVGCDAEKFSSAVSELLDNAVRFSPEGKTVTVEVDVHDDYMLTISINDEGPGMEPEFFAATLGPFEKEKGFELDGDGLGLPLVKAIMEAHGGALEIRSMPGEGTTVMMVVPADRVQISEEHVA